MSNAVMNDDGKSDKPIVPAKGANKGGGEPCPAGCYDMSGNVWQWCNDWYGSGYYTTCDNLGTVTDPEGGTSGSSRVSRGGSWFSYGDYCRSANRNVNDPDAAYYNGGFRIAWTQ
jgi:formylglycine-generating enzyme